MALGRRPPASAATAYGKYCIRRAVMDEDPAERLTNAFTLRRREEAGGSTGKRAFSARYQVNPSPEERQGAEHGEKRETGRWGTEEGERWDGGKVDRWDGGGREKEREGGAEKEMEGTGGTVPATRRGEGGNMAPGAMAALGVNMPVCTTIMRMRTM